jgi:hypothetical protein
MPLCGVELVVLLNFNNLFLNLFDVVSGRIVIATNILTASELIVYET